jgi:hypothetical protein
MATINQKTKLFEGLTDQEAKDLQIWVEGLYFRGTITSKQPMIHQWLDFFGVGTASIADALVDEVGPKVLLSLLAKRDNEFGEVCKELHTAPASGHDGVMEAIRSLTDACDMALGTR